MAKSVPVKVRIASNSVSVQELTKAFQKLHIGVIYGIIQNGQYSSQQAAKLREHMQFLLQEESGVTIQPCGKTGCKAAKSSI